MEHGSRTHITDLLTHPTPHKGKEKPLQYIVPSPKVYTAALEKPSADRSSRRTHYTDRQHDLIVLQRGLFFKAHYTFPKATLSRKVRHKVNANKIVARTLCKAESAICAIMEHLCCDQLTGLISVPSTCLASSCLAPVVAVIPSRRHRSIKLRDLLSLGEHNLNRLHCAPDSD
ncbi:hypothetical protein J6590_021748 [Homalodisca vitripennis]|nr:hypothetical protein J6590_021748 [Homalodisca vitripennis]